MTPFHQCTGSFTDPDDLKACCKAKGGVYYTGFWLYVEELKAREVRQAAEEQLVVKCTQNTANTGSIFSGTVAVNQKEDGSVQEVAALAHSCMLEEGVLTHARSILELLQCNEMDRADIVALNEVSTPTGAGAVVTTADETGTTTTGGTAVAREAVHGIGSGARFVTQPLPQ